MYIEQTDWEQVYIAESMTTDHHVYKTVLYIVDKSLRGQNILQSVVIDSAMYLLTISSPDIDNVAMNLYTSLYMCVLHVVVSYVVHCTLSCSGTRAHEAPQVATGEELQQDILQAFSQLGEELRHLPALPLAVNSLQGASPAFRYTQVNGRDFHVGYSVMAVLSGRSLFVCTYVRM